MKIIFLFVRMCLLLVLLCLNVSRAGESTEKVSWDEEGYQIALWKLYHQTRPMLGRHYDGKIEVENAYEEKTFQSENLTVHTWALEKKLATVPQTHRMIISVFVYRENASIASVEPSIRFLFESPAPLASLQNKFVDQFLVSRLVRLESFSREMSNARGVTSINVAFTALRNRNLSWACNGFDIETNVLLKQGGLRAFRYEVGSALDPFVDITGNKRNLPFIPKDALINPEVGPAGELEKSGRSVFVKQ